MIKKINKSFLFIFLILFAFGCDESTRKLPYLGNADVVYYEKKGVVYSDTVFPKIPSFKFLNQDSIWVNNKNYKDKIWIVEFFFTSCPTICPIMTNQLKRLHRDLEKENAESQKIMTFLSFSIDPSKDKPSLLKTYKQHNGITYKNWDFLTGNEKLTHKLGIENFLTFAGKDELEEGGYAHSGSYTLVDRKGYVRGVYAVTNFDLTVNEDEYKRMFNDINTLIDEHTTRK